MCSRYSFDLVSFILVNFSCYNILVLIFLFFYLKIKQFESFKMEAFVVTDEERKRLPMNLLFSYNIAFYLKIGTFFLQLG